MSGLHRKASQYSIGRYVTSGLVAGLVLAGSVGVANAGSLGPGPGQSATRVPSGSATSGVSVEAAKWLPNSQKHKHKPKSAHAKTHKKVQIKDIIALAEKQVGIMDDGAGGGTKYQNWYMTTRRAMQTVARDGGSVGGYANAEWCDMFVSWLGHKLGISKTLGVDPWTVAHAQWFQAQQRWGNTPVPGALVFFSWRGGSTIDSIQHVGLVVDVYDDGTIQTVEGNVDGGQVVTKHRDTSQVVGYGYPVYAK